MKYFVLILLMIGFVSIVNAGCDDGQININSASLTELDELTGIGPAYAGRIVENRPFESVDDLIKVSGIGPVTLENIKTQGFACVDSEETEEVVEENIEENILSLNSKVVVGKKVETISLNNKVAEEKDDLVYASKNSQVVSYLPYGFAIFLIFIIGFLIWERF